MSRCSQCTISVKISLIFHISKSVHSRTPDLRVQQKRHPKTSVRHAANAVADADMPTARAQLRTAPQGGGTTNTPPINISNFISLANANMSEQDQQHDTINGSKMDDTTWTSWLTSSVASIPTFLSDVVETSLQTPASDDENETPAAAIDDDQLAQLQRDFTQLAPTSPSTSSPDAPATTEASPFDFVDQTERTHLFKQIYALAGMDLVKMRLSLPIWLFEPTTSLTRMAETFEFSDLLDRAATVSDPIHRDSLIASFVVSAFAHTERVRKPFNPVLGETFEFIHPVTDMKFYAEQVSHHPPISVSRAEGNGWVAGEVVNVHATFQGNSVEVSNSGTRYIHLTETDDRYTWDLPKALVSNLFVGGTFVDHHGLFEVRNHTTKTVSRIQFSKCGWFSTGRYDVTGELFDPKGEKVVDFSGAWNRYLDSAPVTETPSSTTVKSMTKIEGVNRLWMAGPHLLTEEEGGGPTGTFAHCTKFTKRTLACDADYATELPPTDSRLRPDRIALEQGDSTAAAEQKLHVEKLQRERHEQVELEGGGAKEPPAQYFRQIGDDENQWEPTGTYWMESRSYTDDDEKRAQASLW